MDFIENPTPEQRAAVEARVSPEHRALIEIIAKAFAPVVRQCVQRLIDPIIERLLAVEHRILEIEKSGVKYCGTYQRALGYKRGSIVTESGSAWAALADVPEGEHPGKCATWQLMVKSGRDAR